MQPKQLKKIRTLVVFFMVMLALSGITAFPVYTELHWLKQSGLMDGSGFAATWLNSVYIAVAETQERFPFLFYGYDWLAFAHIVIAMLFIGVYQHPVRNRWIIQWAIITCIGVLPLAFIAGSIRGIPFFHILIDCSFGIVGLIPLFIIQDRISKLKKYRTKERMNR